MEIAEAMKVDTTGDEGVIPPKSNRKKARYFNKDLYKERTLSERIFSKLKHFRCVSTRYDKTALAYLVIVTIAYICL